MRGEDRALAKLAESVADGTPVDWQAAETQNPQIKRLARHLRLVDSISALHRSIPSEEAAAAPADRHPDRGRRWGRLVLLEQIGSGASCDVYRAWDAELHRDVALKLLHEEGTTAPAERPGALQSSDGDEQTVQMRVLQEARRMARLRHEHVVQVYGAEQHDGRVGLWMELVRGTSLEQLVQLRGSFGANEAALLGLDVCAALAAVHGAGLLHRDVKAQNVMREDGGRVVLMDFGTGEDVSGTNRLVGTPLYLAPEIFEGQRASVQSDVYAVGVLLFYLVTGRFPVTARSMEDLARAHRQRERRSLRDLRPDVPQGFVGAVERSLDSDPARRFKTVGELERALRDSFVSPQRSRLVEGRPEPDADAGSPATSRRRSSTLVVVVAAIVAALVIAAAVFLWTRNRAAADSRPPRVAVLPFRLDGAAGAPPYLADRLTDDLIATLGHVKALQVTSLESVLPFRGTQASMPQVGRSLQVDSLVEATLHVTAAPDGTPDRVKVHARLFKAGSGGEIWNAQFERPLGEARQLYSELAKGILGALGVVPKPEELRFFNNPPSTLAAANDAYALGMHLLSQSSSDAEGAVAAFRRALEIDPNHAGAHAGLARGMMAFGFNGTLQHAAARATAATEVRRALELDPDSSEARAVEADLRFYYDWDWPGAEQSYRRAIDLNPSFARARSQYARYLAAAGRSAEAIAEAQRGVALEPASASAVSTRALMEYYARDYSSALASVDHAIDLEPNSASHYLVRGRILSSTGDLAAAIESIDRAVALRGNSVPTSWRVHAVRLRALAGDRIDARRQLAAVMATIAAAKQTVYPAHLAYVYEALGDRDGAIGLLERAISDRDPDVLWLGVDPRVDGLRSDPRFAQVVERLGRPH